MATGTPVPHPPGSYAGDNPENQRRSSLPAGRSDNHDNQTMWWIAAAITGLIAFVGTIVAAKQGSGWHWVWWTIAILTFAAAIYYIYKRHSNDTLKWILLGVSTICSLIVLYSWWDYRSSSDNEATPTATTATGQAQPPNSTNAAVAVVAPDPNRPLFDEYSYDEDAVPGAAHLVELRQNAANLQLPPGDNDFRSPYSASELQRLADWELNYLRAQPNNQKVTDLAHHIGIGGKPDGRVVADYLQANARLAPVGPDGLRVNYFSYNSAGEVVWLQELTLLPETLVWFRNGTNEPIIQWNGFNLVIPVR